MAILFESSEFSLSNLAPENKLWGTLKLEMSDGDLRPSIVLTVPLQHEDHKTFSDYHIEAHAYAIQLIEASSTILQKPVSAF